MGLFDSPRERAAKDLYGKQLGSYDDILNAISGLQSTQAGISDIPGLRSKFGLTSAREAYGPAKRNLATRRAQSLSSASARMGNRVATPESYFGGIESAYGGAFGELESQASQAEIGSQQWQAGLLEQILRAQDEYNMRKQGMRLGGLGQKGQGIADYTGALSGASTFDDILATASTASKFIKPF